MGNGIYLPSGHEQGEGFVLVASPVRPGELHTALAELRDAESARIERIEAELSDKNFDYVLTPINPEDSWSLASLPSDDVRCIVSDDGVVLNIEDLTLPLFSRTDLSIREELRRLGNEKISARRSRRSSFEAQLLEALAGTHPARDWRVLQWSTEARPLQAMARHMVADGTTFGAELFVANTDEPDTMIELGSTGFWLTSASGYTADGTLTSMITDGWTGLYPIGPRDPIWRELEEAAR